MFFCRSYLFFLGLAALWFSLHGFPRSTLPHPFVNYVCLHNHNHCSIPYYESPSPLFHVLSPFFQPLRHFGSEGLAGPYSLSLNTLDKVLHTDFGTKVIYPTPGLPRRLRTGRDDFRPFQTPTASVKAKFFRSLSTFSSPIHLQMSVLNIKVEFR